ncbi:MAG: aminotransferase class V-fold PLP-dependent enzyme, partial [Methanosarcinales archaeon]|nr:aminotransferase class V-fold PLP-dependent enzyme [Methanosarcinales archaeon]
MQQDIDLIMRATEAHHEWYRDCLPMIASNNLTSNRVRLLAATDLAHRYAEGVVGHRFYQGCQYIDEIEAKTITLAKDLFRAEHVNVQPTSGVNANIAAFFALADPGDTIISLEVPQGGHISHVRYSAAGVRGLRVIAHPFDPEIMNIDTDRMVAMIRETKPRIVLLGGSLFLFPHPVREACEAAREVGATVVYDGAHVLGLIAGNCFQDPLREGADVMTGSTHKTFPGPQGAVIFCKEGLSEKIDEAVFPGTVSN